MSDVPLWVWWFMGFGMTSLVIQIVQMILLVMKKRRNDRYGR